jgi:hypothetical protein
LQCIAIDCKCNAKIENGTFVRTNNVPHIHSTNHEIQAEYERAFQNLREAVRTQETPIRKLHRNALKQNLSEEVLAKLSWEKCRKTLQRIRSAKMPPCGSLLALENLLEDESSFVYSKYGTVKGSRFYQASVNGNLIFAIRDLIKELPENFDMFVDGTFGITPFSTRNQQLLVIFGEIQKKPRPLAYIIMNGKSAKDYASVFEFLRDAVFSFDGTIRKPKRATCDFESGMRSGMKAVWKDIELIGCYFHFTQALGRNAGPKISRGTKAHKKILWLFKRLALLPIEKVDEGYQEIVRYIRQEKLFADFKDYLAYFRQTWFVRFPKKQWNVSSVVRRTNNNIEGYNHKLKIEINSNPSPWEFLDSLNDIAIEAITSLYADKMTNKSPVDRSRLTKPLKKALDRLQTGSITVFGFLEELTKDFSSK